MTTPRVDALIARLEKGRRKTFEIFNALTPEQWQMLVYPDPPWRVQDLLAHFVSAETYLPAIAREVACGGNGAPAGMDIDRINADEQIRLAGQAPSNLLGMMDEARRQTIEWVQTLNDDQLDRVGRHPALGEVTVEAMVTAIYGHQLLHMRELSRLAGDGDGAR
jgi:hypothetical protein